jgi:uncharacterized protein YcgI (DUF1989 family)
MPSFQHIPHACFMAYMFNLENLTFGFTNPGLITKYETHETLNHFMFTKITQKKNQNHPKNTPSPSGIQKNSNLNKSD